MLESVSYLLPSMIYSTSLRSQAPEGAAVGERVVAGTLGAVVIHLTKRTSQRL